MANTPTEASVVSAILKHLNSRPDTYARKTTGTTRSRGWPDIVGCHRGRFLALEVKRPGGSYGATPLQAAELTKWARAGAIAGVVTSVEETIEALKR